MARALSIFPSALLAASRGMSSNAFYKELQQLGLGARRSDVLNLYKLARGIVSVSSDEPFRDITATPTASEISPWPTRKATGFTQTVTLVYRDRTTGSLAQTYYRTNNAQPITRQQAMASAISAYADHAEEYDQDLVGAVHTSTYQNIPTSDQGS